MLKSLLNSRKGRIYVYLATKDIAEQFMRDAESEGFTFGDSVKPTEREPSDIMAINRDMTINYVGFVGHLAYQIASKIGDEPLVKIDYRDCLKSSK